MEVVKWLINCNYRKNRTSKIKYIVVHYTAGLSSKSNNAINTVKNTFNIKGKNASAHYVVDDYNIIQCVEDYDTAYHCGTTGTYKHKECRNANSIGIEICSNYKGGIPSGKTYNDLKATDPNWYFTEKSLKNAEELIAELCKKYNIPMVNVIRHYDVTGKTCPAPFVNGNGFNDWLRFKKNILNIIEKGEKEVGGIIYNKIEELPEWAKNEVKFFIDNGYLNGIGCNLLLSEDMVRLLVILYRVLHKGG